MAALDFAKTGSWIEQWTQDSVCIIKVVLRKGFELYRLKPVASNGQFVGRLDWKGKQNRPNRQKIGCCIYNICNFFSLLLHFKRTSSDIRSSLANTGKNKYVFSDNIWHSPTLKWIKPFQLSVCPLLAIFFARSLTEPVNIHFID